MSFSRHFVPLSHSGILFCTQDVSTPSLKMSEAALGSSGSVKSPNLGSNLDLPSISASTITKSDTGFVNQPQSFIQSSHDNVSEKFDYPRHPEVNEESSVEKSSSSSRSTPHSAYDGSPSSLPHLTSQPDVFENRATSDLSPFELKRPWEER